MMSDSEIDLNAEEMTAATGSPPDPSPHLSPSPITDAHRWSKEPPRLVRRQGSNKIIRYGIARRPWRDFHHTMLQWPVPLLLLVLVVIYGLVNAGFAELYLLHPGSIQNARPGSFWDAFFFSTQTISTVGYGALTPANFYGNAIAASESLSGVLLFTISAALLFERFSRPTARVRFTQQAVITTINGQRVLMFRAANERRNQILQAAVKLTVLRSDTTKEGVPFRRQTDLILSRSQTPIFSLTWSIIHELNEASPLYDYTPETLRESDLEIIVLFTGIDETINQPIHARHSFIASDILWNRRFVDILMRREDGTPVVDYHRFDDTIAFNPALEAAGET